MQPNVIPISCAPSALLSFIKVIFDNSLTMVYIGCGHSRSDCSRKRTQIEISADSESTFEQVISKSIHRASSGDKHLHLKTLGRPMSVKVDAKQKAPRIFSAEDAIKMKLEADRQLFAILRCIRATFGKSSVQKGIKSALHDRQNIFEVKKIPMESYGGAITPHSVIYCVDVDLFINRITALRPNTANDFTVKFGIDYGQSFLKVTMTLATPSRHSSGQRNSSLNGDKKTMLLAFCQAPETYANLKSHFILLKAPPD